MTRVLGLISDVVKFNAEFRVVLENNSNFNNRRKLIVEGKADETYNRNHELRIRQVKNLV